MAWTANDILDQSGRTAIVTGANSGIGLYTAIQLAEKGAHVRLACRNIEKRRAAIADIVQSIPRPNAPPCNWICLGNKVSTPLPKKH